MAELRAHAKTIEKVRKLVILESIDYSNALQRIEYLKGQLHENFKFFGE